jgi:hypothetical protein
MFLQSQSKSIAKSIKNATTTSLIETEIACGITDDGLVLNAQLRELHYLWFTTRRAAVQSSAFIHLPLRQIHPYVDFKSNMASSSP